jgi:hypothetical protein
MDEYIVPRYGVSPKRHGQVLRMRNKRSGCVLKNYVKTRDGARFGSSLFVAVVEAIL